MLPYNDGASAEKRSNLENAKMTNRSRTRRSYYEIRRRSMARERFREGCFIAAVWLAVFTVGPALGYLWGHGLAN